MGPPLLLCTFMPDFCCFIDESQPPFPEVKEFTLKAYLILYPLLGLYNPTNLPGTALCMPVAPV